MPTFSPPPYRIPIGFVQVGGQSLPVLPEKSFWDYFATYVYERIGGATGVSTSELEALVEATQAALEAAAPRRPPTVPLADAEPAPRSSRGEIQALADRVQSLESQLRSARSEVHALTRAMADLEATSI